MTRTYRRVATTLVAVAAAMMLQAAYAQPGGGRGGRGGFGGRGLFGGTTQKIVIAQLAEVQENLKLDDAAKQAIADVSQELNEQRQNVVQDNRDDFQAMREALDKLNADIDTKLLAALSEPQQKRLQQVYIQVNGALALSDKAVADALKMTEEQQADYAEALAENRRGRGGFGRGGGQNLTPEERAQRFAERIAERDKALLAVLSDEQQKQFEEMKGEELEIDMTAMRRGFRGGRGGFGGRGGRNQ